MRQQTDETCPLPAVESASRLIMLTMTTISRIRVDLMIIVISVVDMIIVRMMIISEIGLHACLLAQHWAKVAVERQVGDCSGRRHLGLRHPG